MLALNFVFYFAFSFLFITKLKLSRISNLYFVRNTGLREIFRLFAGAFIATNFLRVRQIYVTTQNEAAKLVNIAKTV